MNKEEFLSQLRKSLKDQVDSYELNNQLNYYSEYISSGQGDKTEEQIIELIGDPRLIAKTILSTYEISHDPLKGMHRSEQSFDDQEKDNNNSHAFRFKWYHKLLLGLLILIILFALVRVFIFMIPVIVILLLLKFVFNRFRKL